MQGQARHVRKWFSFFQIAVPVLIGCGVLLICELAFRVLIFSSLPFAEKFRDPSLYADYDGDDEYWLLRYHFDGHYKPPSKPHPVLGWVSPSLDWKTLVHHNLPRVAGRRPVLLYGDSFAECAEHPCFEDVLNNDAAFSKNCFLLNNGVSGYGLDQIYLLMNRTLQVYKEPIVVFSLLTQDIDRSMLSLRTWKKPRFTLEDGKLVLTGLPIEGDPLAFLESNRPQFYSYLFRMALYGRVLPASVAMKLRGEYKKRAQKIALTQAIFKETMADLRSRNLPFVFLIFVEQYEIGAAADPWDWRYNTLVHFLDQDKMPYISARDILRENMATTGNSLGQYFILNDGHHNAYANMLIADRLKLALPMCTSQ